MRDITGLQERQTCQSPGQACDAGRRRTGTNPRDQQTSSPRDARGEKREATAQSGSVSPAELRGGEVEDERALEICGRLDDFYRLARGQLGVD